MAETQLDLLFLIDATGSMGDEIAKLKASMADVADQIARLPEQPDVRYGLVAYRDLGDSYVVQHSDFTADLGRFQRSLSKLRADGGGDEPESLNEALNTAVHGMSWRSEDTVRMVVLVADAPPHLDYDWQPFSYETDVVEAVRRGIKLFPVGASGLSVDGEYIFRQLAQFTGGKFVFLTYADGSNPKSGPGVETDHDVDNYSVETLDRLIVRAGAGGVGPTAADCGSAAAGPGDGFAVGRRSGVSLRRRRRVEPTANSRWRTDRHCPCPICFGETELGNGPAGSGPTDCVRHGIGRARVRQL